VWTQPHERALLLEARWRIDPADEEARSTAADLYRDLHARTPSVAYRQAFAFLTGAYLTPGPPLPPLPEALEEEAVDLPDLLMQVDRIVEELTGSRSGLIGGDRLGPSEPA
jgi:hypothetical protein